MNKLAFIVRLDTPFEQALEAVIAALKVEGFGSGPDLSDVYGEADARLTRVAAALAA